MSSEKHAWNPEKQSGLDILTGESSTYQWNLRFGTYVEGGRKRFPDAGGTIAFRGFNEKQKTAMRLGQSQEGESTQTLRKGNGL